MTETTLDALTGETPSHSYGDWITSDADNHWKVCACGKKDQEGAHADADQNGKCDTCDKEMPLPHTHAHATEWSKDDTKHWHECSCGDKKDEAEHSFGDWNVTKQPTATEAGTRERACICGATQTESIPATGEVVAPNEERGLPTGAVVAIVIGSATVAAGGGFAVWWFVISKRSLAQLGLGCKSLGAKIGNSFVNLKKRIFKK